MINGELIVDNFAGGGGASTGIELATGISVDVAINHDPEAIRMHKANHPSTRHYCESVWNVNPVEACKGHPVALAWFSPDCKHFSKAKGGKPKDKTIRGLAWVALRWAALVRPRVIMLENVEEFKTWGPLNRSHRPIKAKQGNTFQKFVSQLKELGYTVEYRELIAADYGAPTMRKRFFLIARCDGNSIVWPNPTHGPKNSAQVREGLLKPHVGAYTQLDFSLPCPSIFDTSEEIKEKHGIWAVRPLAVKTMERIVKGFKKFVIDNTEPFIVQVNSSKSNWMTIDDSNRHSLVSLFLCRCFSNGYRKDCDSLEKSLPMITALDNSDAVISYLIQMNNHCDGRDITKPIPTITAGDGHFGEVRVFLKRHCGRNTGRDIEKTLNTVTTRDGFWFITIHDVTYRIVDIGLRMLEPKELYGCQGFPDDYIIDCDYTGKKYPRNEQVRRCGNAVCPPIPAALVRANLPELCRHKRVPNMRIDDSEEQLRFAI